MKKSSFILAIFLCCLLVVKIDVAYAERKLSVKGARTVPVKEEVQTKVTELPQDSASQETEPSSSSESQTQSQSQAQPSPTSPPPQEVQEASEPPSSSSSSISSPLSESSTSPNNSNSTPHSPSSSLENFQDNSKDKKSRNSKDSSTEPKIFRNRIVQNEQTLVTWYGHSFIYLISKSGVRVAIDPFGEGVRLPFPKDLNADIVLISYEATDRNGADQLKGSPQVFRGIAGSGTHRVCGILFKGVETWRDHSRGIQKGKNIVYIVEMDGIRFCHLGGIGDKLKTEHYDQIGHVDVLFIPIGNPLLSVADLFEMTKKLDAKLIVPIAYCDAEAGMAHLRSPDEFNKNYPEVIKPQEKEAHKQHNKLPAKPTLLMLPKLL